MNSTPAISSAFLKAANRTADLVDEGKFHAEVAVLTIGQAATRLVERRDGALLGGDTAIDAGEGRGPS
jgi:predicted solute-binding protein